MINEDIGLETESLGLEGSDHGIVGVLEADMALSLSLAWGVFSSCMASGT